jgi:hypothetical protein
MPATLYAKKCRKRHKQVEQLSLFTVTLRSAYLEACDSPKKAFYRIWIEESDGKIKVVKESGIKGRVLDRRSWLCADRGQAEKAYRRRIDQKTDPLRNSPRKYRLIIQSEK